VHQDGVRDQRDALLERELYGGEDGELQVTDANGSLEQ
jgi:hypothetical protein